ncbi:hypothetical protein CSW98_14415 [Vibrio sp. HA2012]|uniref:YrbL family protein n=1 Tax=Vibrio sp. HA2012 TaxID=1971595 RepID=UPI000C2B9EFB|nr:YrbL family protein [Vibrio sp. HA2012]PJC85383.1 hypothetical protein CSW98_14415 [Vibrio sp. HA2012]
MIHIDKSGFVGRGHHREVYRHPQRPELCIKVIFDNQYDTREIEREKSYYKHLQNRGISWDLLSQYHGDVDTDLGAGSVFDLVVDTDNSVSKTLGYYLSDPDRTQTYYSDLLKTLADLKHYLLEQRIITKSLAHRNIVCQKTPSGITRMVIIDNIGNAEFLPLSNYISFMGRKKVGRKWQRFEKKLAKEFSDNQALHNLLKDLNK